MSGYERPRYAVLYSKELGRGHVIDLFEKRRRALQRRVAAWAALVLEYRANNPTRMVMITLTYAAVGGWKGMHIRNYMMGLTNKLRGKLLAAAWVAEMQARGAVHYHLILLTTKGARIPTPDKSGMWPHGSSRIEAARTPYYLVKYTGKQEQKDIARFPKGCHGHSCTIKFGGVEMKARYREAAGMLDESVNEGAWSYMGSAVTLAYARDVLIPKL